MAITISATQVAAAIRAGNSTEELTEIGRLLAVATKQIETYLGDQFANAPEVIVNEASVRIVGYLYDRPFAARGAAYANALRNSGAGATLLPYRKHRAGGTAAAETAAPDGMGGTTDNPVTNVTVSGSTLTVHYADGSTADRTLAGGGGAGVDQAARDAAAAAQSTADANAADIAALPGPYTLPAAAADTRGGVEAVTNAIIDAGTSTGIFGWGLSHVKRIVTSLVPAWARDSTTAVPPAKLPAPDVLHVAPAGVFSGTENLIVLRDVPDAVTGRRYGFFVEAANTGAVTVTVNNAAAQPLIGNDGSALTGGELVVGEFIEIVDAGTRFRIISGSATGHAGGPDASETRRGTVLLARVEDVGDSETDLSRVPTLTRAITLIRRLIGENVRSIPEAEASHVGFPLVAASASRPWGAWRQLTGAGIAENTIAESNMTADARAKLNAGSTDQAARDAAAAAGRVAMAAALSDDTVIEVGPAFIHEETGPKNLSISLRHPVNAYARARLMTIAPAGQPAVIVGYDHTVIHQDTLAEVSAAALQNIWDQTDAVDDGSGGTTNVARYPAGSYIPVEIRLITGRGGDTVFIRVVDVPVIEVPSAPAPAAPTLLATLASTSTQSAHGTDAQFDKVRAALNGTAFRSIRIEATYPRTFAAITDGEGYVQAEWQIPSRINVPAGGSRDVYFREFGGVASDQSGIAEVLSMVVRPGAASGRRLNVSHRLPNNSTIRIYGVP